MKFKKCLQQFLICLGLFGLLGNEGLALTGSFQESFEKEISFDNEEEIEAIASRKAEVRLIQASAQKDQNNFVVYRTSPTRSKCDCLTFTPLFIKHRSLLI